MGNYSIISSDTESDIKTRELKSINFDNKIAGDRDESYRIFNNITVISESYLINYYRIKNEGGRWKNNNKNIINNNNNNYNNYNNYNNKNHLVNRKWINKYTNNKRSSYTLLARLLIFIVVSSITMQLITVESSPTPSLKNQIETNININNNNKNNNNNNNINNNNKHGADDYNNYNNEYNSIENYLPNELTMDNNNNDNNNENRIIIDNEMDELINEDGVENEEDEEVEINRFSDDYNQRQSEIIYGDDDDDDDDDHHRISSSSPPQPPSPQSPHHHSSRSSLDSEELDKIRKSIMEDLGLARIPDPSKANVSQTEYEKAHREYLKRTELSSGHDRRTRRKLHVFYPADRVFDNASREIIEKNDIEGGYYERNSIYFPVEIPIDNHAVDHAVLRILIEVNKDINYLTEDYNNQSILKDIEISIYQPTRSSNRRLISRRKVSVAPSAPRWADFDSTEAVASWIHEGEENLGLEVEISDSVIGWSLLKSGPSGAALNIFTISDARPDRSNRMRRATPDQLISLHRGRRTECRGQNKKCCRHQMTVIFKDLKGFEFIIQPKNFDAGYCKGRCPPRYNPAHHHALLQSLISKEDRRKAPRPCCAPSKLTELEILYFDEDDETKLKVSNWKNMKVLECACS